MITKTNKCCKDICGIVIAFFHMMLSELRIWIILALGSYKQFQAVASYRALSIAMKDENIIQCLANGNITYFEIEHCTLDLYNKYLVTGEYAVYTEYFCSKYQKFCTFSSTRTHCTSSLSFRRSGLRPPPHLLLIQIPCRGAYSHLLSHTFPLLYFHCIFILVLVPKH